MSDCPMGGERSENGENVCGYSAVEGAGGGTASSPSRPILCPVSPTTVSKPRPTPAGHSIQFGDISSGVDIGGGYNHEGMLACPGGVSVDSPASASRDKATSASTLSLRVPRKDPVPVGHIPSVAHSTPAGQRARAAVFDMETKKFAFASHAYGHHGVSKGCFDAVYKKMADDDGENGLAAMQATILERGMTVEPVVPAPADVQKRSRGRPRNIPGYDQLYRGTGVTFAKYGEAVVHAAKAVKDKRLTLKAACEEVSTDFKAKVTKSAVHRAVTSGQAPSRPGCPPGLGYSLESMLVSMIEGLRSLKYPVFKDTFIGSVNRLIKGTMYEKKFPNGVGRAWLRRFLERNKHLIDVSAKSQYMFIYFQLYSRSEKIISFQLY
jgi:hypothetical protein